MKISTPRILLCISFITLVFSGCESPFARRAAAGDAALRSYITKELFTPFIPPRSGDGAGTIISFDSRGVETIVASVENCFSPLTVIPHQETILVLQNQLDLSNDDKIALSLPAAVGRKIDFNASLAGNGVAKVKFQLIEPFKIHITLFDAQTFVQQLPPSSRCRQILSNPDNLIVHTVLGAKGIEYSFYDKNDTKLVLTANLLSALKVDPTLTRTSEGTSSLSLKDRDMLFGYRAWKGTFFSGFGESGVKLTSLRPEEIESIRIQKTTAR